MSNLKDHVKVFFDPSFDYSRRLKLIFVYFKLVMGNHRKLVKNLKVGTLKATYQMSAATCRGYKSPLAYRSRDKFARNVTACSNR